eukprot:193833_1
MATTQRLKSPPMHSNREIDALLVESTQRTNKKLICNKTFLLIATVSLLIIVLIGITVGMVAYTNHKTATAPKQDILPYPVVCCNTFNHKALCIHFNTTCSWTEDDQCTFIESPTLFENDICFPSIAENESCLEHQLEEDSTDYWDDIPQFDVRDELSNHSQNQFPSPPQPTVVCVTDGVYVAIGYDLANTIFIETANGIVVIDTLSQTSAAKEAFNDYRSLRLGTLNRTINNTRNASQMYIEAIILTHYHADHVMAISFWMSLNQELGVDTTPKVYANKGLIDGFKNFMIYARTSRSTRSARQFGTIIRDLDDEELIREKQLFINAGIGPFLRTGSNISFINPLDDRYFVLLSDEDYVLHVDGNVTLRLVHSPGDTQDQISVWYEAKKALFVGDNIYYAFPNLYAIRGTTARDPKKWIQSLDVFIRDYRDNITDNITHELILYRDLIAFVHDQTIRSMTAGLSVDDAVLLMQSTRPEALSKGRNQELYGTLEWSVRSIYDLYNGWFDGDSSSLYLLFNKLYHHRDAAHGDMITVLISYLNDVLDGAEDMNYFTVITKEERWVLEIVTALSSFYDEYKQCEQWKELMDLRWSIVHKVAGRSISANGRNYLISQYLQERFGETLENEGNEDGEAFIRNVYLNWPIEWVVELLRYRVNPMEIQRSNGTEWKTNIKFVDSGLMFSLWLRNGGVLCVEEYSKYSNDRTDDEATLIYEMKESDYKLQDVRNISLVAKGTELEINEFWSKFDHAIFEM